jgi:hypothetical protein
MTKGAQLDILCVWHVSWCPTLHLSRFILLIESLTHDKQRDSWRRYSFWKKLENIDALTIPFNLAKTKKRPILAIWIQFFNTFQEVQTLFLIRYSKYFNFLFQRYFLHWWVLCVRKKSIDSPDSTISYGLQWFTFFSFELQLQRTQAQVRSWKWLQEFSGVHWSLYESEFYKAKLTQPERKDLRSPQEFIEVKVLGWVETGSSQKLEDAARVQVRTPESIGV